MKVLFVCNMGIHRSKTAANIFSDRFETQSAGIYTDISKEKIDWADVIIVMEDHQRKMIGELFPSEYIQKRILCLDIPDIYNYKEPPLIRVLKLKVEKAVREL